MNRDKFDRIADRVAKTLTAKAYVRAENSSGRATDVEIEIQNWLSPSMCRVGDYYFDKTAIDKLIGELKKAKGKLK